MDNSVTPETLWAALLAGASALVLLANAGEKVVKAVKAAKAPNQAQNERLDRLEDWQEGVDRKLDNDSKRLEAIESGDRVSQRALLALLSHGIDGNNTQQMQDARDELQNHLINR